MTNVWPLPFTPFESYLLNDDRPGYRMQFVMELTFDGEIDRAAFDVGFAEAVSRHPLLNALMERRRFGQMWWVPPGAVQPPVDWADWDQPLRFPDDPGFDLTREVGLRCNVRVGGGRSKLALQYHHSCCDGVGAIHFFQDWLTGYVRHLEPHSAHPPEFLPTNPLRLRQRNEIKVKEAEEISRWRFVRPISKLLWQQTWNPAAPLAAPKAALADAPQLAFPQTLTRTLESGVHSALRMIARRLDTSLHELLVRELLLTNRDWNRLHGSEQPHDIFSVMVPINLRHMEHDDLSAANVLGYVTFPRNLAELNDPAALIESIRAESLFHRNTRYASKFVSGLNIAHCIPGAMRFLLNREHCFATSVLSTIGDPSRLMASRYPLNSDGNPIMANLVMTDVNCAPPLRPLTRALFSAWHFSDKQRLGVRCDPQHFNADQSQQLLDLFAERVVALAATASEFRKPKRIAA